SQRRGIHVLASTSWGMLYGAGFMVLVALVRGHDFIIDPTITYLGSLAWLIVISSVMTFACYLSLIGRIGPGRAAYATVVFPIFALLISARYEGYEWGLLSLAGMGLVIIGNLMMIRARD
ncbi:MAG: EamA family transporter, partial [Rhodobiaceae bacterium]